MLGVKELPDVPVEVEELPHEEVVELYQLTDVVSGPVYVTLAVRAEADWPTVYESGPAGVTLTVGSANRVTRDEESIVPVAESLTTTSPVVPVAARVVEDGTAPEEVGWN